MKPAALPFGDTEALAPLATGRRQSLFADTVERQRPALAAAYAGRRVLIVGGAGSIGAAVVEQIADLVPAALHVVDIDENGLAELVRHLRSRPAGLAVADFRTLPLDCGTPAMARFLNANPRYDAVLNFAALKHVRSEKDPFSLSQMLDTNLVKQVRFMRQLAESGSTAPYFCVSTDKAAAPASLMGASKRLMEHVILGRGPVPELRCPVTTTRFANVAFSNGSLLQSFLLRLGRRQPLAVPEGVRRYFVSLQEAGHICTLAAACAPDRTILVPDLDPAADLVPLEQVARAVLRHFGLEAATYREEAEARAAVGRDLSAGRYPLLVTALDTAGEKEAEIFVAPGETAADIGLDRLRGIAYGAPEGHAATVRQALAELEALCAATAPVDAAALVAPVARAVPEFRHRGSALNLDQRM